MILPAVLLIVLGYALVYTGASQLSQGSFTGGNVQGLATSLGLDKLAANAAGGWKGGGGGPITTTSPGVPGADASTAPLNGSVQA